MQRNGKGSFLLNVDFVNGGSTSITVDSGAEDSVCPKAWGEHFKMTEGKSINFRDASGNKIPHFGERKIKVVSPF